MWPTSIQPLSFDFCKTTFNVYHNTVPVDVAFQNASKLKLSSWSLETCKRLFAEVFHNLRNQYNRFSLHRTKILGTRKRSLLKRSHFYLHFEENNVWSKCTWGKSFALLPACVHCTVHGIPVLSSFCFDVFTKKRKATCVYLANKNIFFDFFTMWYKAHVKPLCNINCWKERQNRSFYSAFI